MTSSIEKYKFLIMRKYVLLLILAWSIGLAATAQSYKNRPCYMFGLAASFNDSTIYVTDIQHLDGAWLYNHEMFLFGRDQYAYQLRDALKVLGFANPTVSIFFSKKKKEIEKKYLKMKKRYSKNGAYNIKYLSTQDFLFSAQKPDDVLVNAKDDKPEKK